MKYIYIYLNIYIDHCNLCFTVHKVTTFIKKTY